MTKTKGVIFMLKYTRASIALILHELKIFRDIFKYASLILSVGYYVYASIAGIGLLPVNIALASVLFAFGVFEVATRESMMGKAKKQIRHIFHWTKIALKAISFGVIIFSMYEATADTVRPFAIIWATLTIILWAIDVLLEIFVLVFEREKDVLLAAIDEDMAEMKDIYRKPVEKVSNFFSKIIHGEQAPEKEPEPDSKQMQRIKKWMDRKKTR